MEGSLWIYTYGKSDLTITAFPEDDKEWLDLTIEVRNEYIEFSNGVCAMKSELEELVDIIDKYIKDVNSYADKEFSLVEYGLIFNFSNTGYVSLTVNFIRTSDKYTLALDKNDLQKISKYFKEQLEKYK